MWRCLILVALLLCVLWVFGCASSGGVPFGTGDDRGSLPPGDGTQISPPSPWPPPPPNPPPGDGTQIPPPWPSPPQPPNPPIWP